MRRRAISYIRKDIAGIHAQRCELHARSYARTHGYDLARTIVDTPDGPGMRQLFDLMGRNPDGVVLLPSLDHVSGTALEAMIDRADLVCGP